MHEEFRFVYTACGYNIYIGCYHEIKRSSLVSQAAEWKTPSQIDICTDSVLVPVGKIAPHESSVLKLNIYLIHYRGTAHPREKRER